MDNCILNAEALVCLKEPPAYTFRDYRYPWWPPARASQLEGTMAWWHLGWEDNPTWALLLWCWGSSQLLELWPGVPVVISACPLRPPVPSSTSTGTLKEELSTSRSWMPRPKP